MPQKRENTPSQGVFTPFRCGKGIHILAVTEGGVNGSRS